MAPTSPELLTTLLQQVSRSFYLTLRVLPGAIRPQIGLAYLLARATDTIADTEIIPVATRLQALQALRERILGRTSEPLNFADIARCQDLASEELERAQLADSTRVHRSAGSSAERILLEKMEGVLLLLHRFSAADQQRIREVLTTIISGQCLDLERFAGASPGQITALQTDRELDDYTYRVAGCVGEFWTRMCRAHLFPKTRLDETALLENGVRFGKGLQLVNILRDLPADLRQGRCYLPAEQLRSSGLTPSALLEPATEPVFRPLFQHYLTQAKDHLAAGWAYTNALPRQCVRVRLGCAWPILIGVRTLERLRSDNVLNGCHRIKIGRADVRKLVARSVLYYLWPTAWNRLFYGCASEKPPSQIGRTSCP